MSARTGATSNVSGALSKSPADVALTSLLVEVGATIRLLESEIPADPGAPRNERWEAGLKADLGNYFRSLEAALPMAELERLYYSQVKQD